MQRKELSCTCHSHTALQANHQQARGNHHFINVHRTAYPPSLLFISSFFLLVFSFSISHFDSVFIAVLRLGALLSFPWFTIVVDASIHQPLYVLMNVDLREECNTRVKDLWVCEVHLRCVSLQACFDVCVMYTEPCQGQPLHSDGDGEECGVQQGCCYGIIEDVSLVSLIIQQVCC